MATTQTPSKLLVPESSARLWAELVAVVVVLIVGVIGFRSWLIEHDARMTAEATAVAQKKAFDAAGDQIKSLQLEADARDKETAVQLAALKATAAAAQTPAQIATFLSNALNRGAPVPITITRPPPTAADPNPAEVATLPVADLSFLRDQVEKCQADAISVKSVGADLTTCQAQTKLAGQQLSAVEIERDAYKKAAAGGSWRSRTWRIVKIAAIAAGAGFAVRAATHK